MCCQWVTPPDQNGTVIVARTAVPDAAAAVLSPLSKKHVRGNILLQCTFITQLASGQCSVKWISCVDPGGATSCHFMSFESPNGCSSPVPLYASSYDVNNEIQDLKIYSHAHSLNLAPSTDQWHLVAAGKVPSAKKMTATTGAKSILSLQDASMAFEPVPEAEPTAALQLHKSGSEQQSHKLPTAAKARHNRTSSEDVTRPKTGHNSTPVCRAPRNKSFSRRFVFVCG